VARAPRTRLLLALALPVLLAVGYELYLVVASVTPPH
jgi:hypothetical protein